MKKNAILQRLAAVCTFVFISQAIIAQDIQQDIQQALALVKKNAAVIGLSNDDIVNSRISDTYVDAVTGATLVYLQQTYAGIDIDKSIQVLAFKNGSLASAAGKRIDLSRAAITRLPGLQKKLATPAVAAASAIQSAVLHLQLPAPSINRRPVANEDFSKRIGYGDLGIAKENVTVRLLWAPQRSFERIKLVWEINVSPKKTPDSWRVIVDAGNGSVIRKDNYTVSDNWDKENMQSSNGGTRDNIPGIADTSVKPPFTRGINSINYKVVPFPAEAPSFSNGTPALVSDPWKLSPAGSGATPFNWNDDGLWQYKITRGNNVLAQEDMNANDSRDGRKAKGTRNNDHLYFDFNPDFNKPPADSVNQGFGITNLFYWNNIMHDLAYQYGFDEKSGNFQLNNLGRGGKGRDYVFADAQDGGGFNNANFYTPPDGENPWMQMYLFSDDISKTMKVNAPASIAGDVAAIEGALSPNNSLSDHGPVTGDVVLYDEAMDTLHNACAPASNGNELKGKIALIRRGTCLFVSKIMNAQNVGAIAVIIIDSIPGEYPFPMGGFDSAIVIPAVMISYEDGMKIREVLSSGAVVNVTLSAPPFIDGDLDNGVICHEYGHGISNRLTGGPGNVTCLFNAERPSEGWSDYISLMTVTDWSKAQVDEGYKAKGVGTYVLGQPTDGPGIRTYPYSVDMNINPHTYANVALFGEVHYIGEIWTSALWDMTWFIIEQDGINKDIFNPQGAGGNSVAYKLVMTGMKLQPCSPGFIDGRDAILKADTLLYGGKYSCLIWKAFARRGMGVGAAQGSSEVTGDETVDFAQAAIFITKHADTTISPNKQLEYTIGLKAKAVCGSDVEQNYSVTDSLPGNVTYQNSDGTYDPSNRTVTFSDINMSNGDSVTYHIRVKVNKDTGFPDSVYLNDPVADSTISDKWVAENGQYLEWSTLNLGIYFYYSDDDSVRDVSSLVTAQEYDVPGITTTFSFYHEMISDDFRNGGVVEVTADGGKTWEDLGPYMSGFVYNQTIEGNSILNGRQAFAGFGFGYTNIDLSAFTGKKVKIRFLYATSDGSFAIPDGGTGWIIDDIVLSASAAVTNTAKLFDQDKALRGSSTVVTKIEPGKDKHDFIAVKHNDTEALLSWHRPGEINGTYQVERSTDNGVSFKVIGTVKATAVNLGTQSYSFKDAAPAAGRNLYRIQHISSKGAADLTDVKALAFDDLKTIQVYPNPAKDKIKIYMPGNNKAVTIQLTDGLGKTVKTYHTGTKNTELSLPALPPGVYYLNIIKADGTSKHKLVIE